MNVILKRSGLALLAAVVLLAGCGGNKPSQPSTPTAPTPTTPAPSPGPSDPPTTPPQPVTCTYAVTAEPDDFDRDGGNGILRIGTAAGCKWSVKTDAAWASVEGATQGDGDAALKVFVQPNDDAQARRMTFTVQDKTVGLTQPGQGDCTFQVSPVAAEIPRLQWSGEVSVTTSRGCTWAASSDSAWLRIGSTSGTGSGRVSYAADINPGAGADGRRLGIIALRWRAPTAGQNVRVIQWGDCTTIARPATGGLPVGATFAGDTTGGAITAAADGGRFHMWILTEPFMGCAWTVESSDAWLGIESPQLHQLMGGDGDLHFTVPANTTGQTRRGAFVIDGRPLTVTQAGK